MLHYSIDLFTLANREFLITDGKTGEKLANFQSLGKDDIAVADRIYGSAQGIAHLRKQGADYVLRLRAGAIRINDEQGVKIDVAQRFSHLMAWGYGEFTGWSRIEGEQAPVPVRVCAVRKDVFAEWNGMQRLKKENGCTHGGKPVSAVQQEYNKYIIVLTSLGKEVSAEQVLQLYRMRWQIELAFKRLKSLFGYNEMPARKPENIKTWFYGKLLLAALSETLVNSGRFPPCAGGGKRRGRSRACQP
jgi:transposase